MNNTIRKRDVRLDLIRILAICQVVAAHCIGPLMTQGDPGTFGYFLGNLVDSICRMSVPLFLMITGALFLDERKEISLKAILGKNVKNLAIITVLWAIFYGVVYQVGSPLLAGEDIVMKDLIKSILKGHYHMWYLYMILGLYIAIPFIKKFVCKANYKMVLFFIVVSFAVQFIKPMIAMLVHIGLPIGFISQWLDQFYLGFFSDYVVYLLVGWYLYHVEISKKWMRFVIYGLGIVSLSLIIGYIQLTGDYLTAYDNMNGLILLSAAFAFLAMLQIKREFKEKTVKFIVLLSNLSFGVYIIHILVLSLLRAFAPAISNPLLYFAVFFGTVLVVSFAITFVLSKIPLLKKLVKG